MAIGEMALDQTRALARHAAVLARQLGKVCLVGCAQLRIDEAARTITLGSTTLHEGEVLTLDGKGGGIYAGAAQTELHCPEDLPARLAALRRAGEGATAAARSGT